MEDAHSATCEFRLLGPIEALRSGERLPLGGRRQRMLLALLLLEPGRPASVDLLVDELWLGEPPPGAGTTLRAYVSRLRRVLGPSAPLTRTGSGYVLDVSLDAVDTQRFERLVGEGQAALELGATGRAAGRLRAALELWHGPPFEDLGTSGALRLEADRLEELRLLALEGRIEADLALGRRIDLVTELETLVREHPYRERLWRHLMLALYRAGRQSDALGAYRRARATLDQELGLEPSEDLKQLQRAILRQEVAIVRPPRERHNLPTPLTSFVGRERELADVERLLGETRLLTLTGVGGSGKTRLALEAATRAVADWPHGVFLVDLSGLSEPSLLAGHVAAGLEIRERSGAPLVEQITAQLRDAELLLVLDNCEHLRDACAELIARLLASCQRLRVLATSRESLGLPGEADYEVPPLGTPLPDAPEADVRASEAVRLLLARARAARPHLADDESVLTAAGRICRDLDGLPLAIEFAAAHAKALSLDDIASRLADRFRFLVTWRRLPPARHRTLREAMDWSYELLSPEEQALLARSSVFAGGFTLDGAAVVCLEGIEERALELVERLVHASLVVAEEQGGQMRYRLLETIRQYAAERLDERGETDVFRRRHAEYSSGLVEDLWTTHLGRLDAWVESLRPEQDNLRSALLWSLDANEPEQLLRLVNAVWRFWWIRGEFSEGRRWLDDALATGARSPPELRAQALEGAAGLAWADADLSRARELAEAARSLYLAVGDPRGEHAALIVLGHVAFAQGDHAAARTLFEETRSLAEKLGQDAVALASHNLASVALGEGDLDRAAALYADALHLYHGEANAYGVALSELYLGIVAAEGGRPEDASGYLARAMSVFRKMGFLQYAAQCVDAIATVVHGRGQHAQAARLLAAASALRERTGDSPTVAARLRERQLVSTRAELDEAEFEAAWADGLSLTPDEALDLAEAALAR